MMLKDRRKNSFHNYLEIRNWLESFIPLVYGKEELGLVRIENLLNKLGNPEKKIKSIHVGGTSGKGTTAFLIANILRMLEKSDGQKNLKFRKIGLHVSPHLVDIRERMQINGKLIPMKRFIGLANKIKPVIDAIIANQPEKTPSYFEILVAMTFLYFAEEKVDWAVVEVGLGGRLDATNVLMPEVSVITNVGMDHTEILGDTIEKIAIEKAGIIKGKRGKSKGKGVPVVTAVNGKALKVIEKAAKGKKAPLITINTQSGNIASKSGSFGSIALPFDMFGHNLYFARKQCILLAIGTILALGFKVDTKTINLFFQMKFGGRFEEIYPNVLIDGAHNEEKVKALIDWYRFKLYRLRTTADSRKSKVFLIVAFKKGKNWKKMIDLLINNLPVSQVIATKYQAVTDTGKGSGVDPKEIAKYVESKWKVKGKSIDNSQKAVFEIISHRIPATSNSDLILVTGSLYLVGEARTLWYLPEF